MEELDKIQELYSIGKIDISTAINKAYMIGYQSKSIKYAKLESSYNKLLEQVKQKNRIGTNNSLLSDSEIISPIENALYATGRFTTDQCTDIAEGILIYINDAGYQVLNQNDKLSNET